MAWSSPSRPSTALHIRNRVEAYLRHSGLSATRFGRDSVGDPGLVAGLRRGREPRAAMIRRLEHFMNKQEENTR